MTSQTAIVSELLCALPDADPQIREAAGVQLLRALDLVEIERGAQTTIAYTASVDAGHVEDLDAWAARVLGPEAVQ
ncbi:hypothetical protein [Streptomyces sp. NBC_01353]|uniref:hypothetical protein n=1 Tax=Streptomyces sp. NBC_01353 TaxID=2903835 RepID=UPI002E317B9F|nr:hypothetical protein [Streptomyces sp. NBC_01353]